MRVAIQGERGSFSHEAALRFVPAGELCFCAYSPEVFRLLGSGSVDAAVLPIENSLAGSVVEHYDLMWRHAVAVERELHLRIEHCLISLPATELKQIHRVYSHPVALAQCHRFFAEHPEMEAVPFYDTAGSVKQLVELRDGGAAAIAGEQAARAYSAKVLLSGIEDDRENFTRFWMLRRAEEVSPSGDVDKLSLAFTVAHQPGTLVHALQALADEGANLTQIQSRPVPGQPWHYVFYVDCVISGAAVADRLVMHLGKHCLAIRELGRYRAGTRNNPL